MPELRKLESATVEKLVKTAIGYLSRDPQRNISKMIKVAKRLALLSEHAETISRFEASLGENAVLRRYVQRILSEVHPKYRNGFLIDLAVHASLLGIPRQQKATAALGVNVPYTILIDPTEACNLHCRGCWAGRYEIHSLPYDLLNRVLEEAKSLGIHFIVLSGGEPTLYPHFFRMAEEHPDIAFMFYTNGTRIDDQMADRMVEVGNLSPAISLEGWREQTDARRGEGVYDRIMHAMDLLKERGIPFGYSVTVTKDNAEQVFSDEFVDFMIDKGAFYGWSFHYIPVGRDPDLDLLISPEQRLWLAERVVQIRETKPIQVFDFWNDGELTQGCIAGGRRYFHITADGGIEPCAFAHFRALNIRDCSLVEALGSELFRAYQKYQPTNGNLLLPCPIIDRPKILRRIVEESGAGPSYDGADHILKGEAAAFLERRAAEWSRVSQPLWNKRQQKKQKAPSLGSSPAESHTVEAANTALGQ